MHKFASTNTNRFVTIVSYLVLWYPAGKTLDKKENGVWRLGLTVFSSSVGRMQEGSDNPFINSYQPLEKSKNGHSNSVPMWSGPKRNCQSAKEPSHEQYFSKSQLTVSRNRITWSRCHPHRWALCGWLSTPSSIWLESYSQNSSRCNWTTEGVK